MGVSISSSEYCGSRRSCRTSRNSTATATQKLPSKPKTESSTAVPHHAQEAARFPLVLPKSEESVGTSCALSCTVSMQGSPTIVDLLPLAREGAQATAAYSRFSRLLSGSPHTTLPTSQPAPKGCTTSLSLHMYAHRAATSVSTPLVGVDVVPIEYASPLLDDLSTDLDDFELAYSRGVQDGLIPAAAAATGSCMSLRSVSRSLSASEVVFADTPSDVDETLAFITLRRVGFSLCRTCGSSLCYHAKFCPECGCSVEEVFGDTLVTTGSGCALESASFAAVKSYPSNNLSGGNFSATTTTATTTRSSDREVVTTALQESNVFTLQRRNAFVRYVKVLRSRQVLGVGTSGTVYRAVDTRTGQQLAVKESLINQNSPDELAAVRNELRQLAQLRHPYIVEYFGCRVEAVESANTSCFQSSQISSHPSALESRRVSRPNNVIDQRTTLFPRLSSNAAAQRNEVVEAKRLVALSTIRVLILMERVECGTLSHLLADFPGGMPEQAVRCFAAQLVDAVRYVHECGLCHRDIKLDNILLASDGTIRLTDFGCAVRGVSGLTGNGKPSIAGTPAYMPPESLHCLEQASVDWTFQGKAQDVWAVGCVVHHLLTAASPWCALASLSPYALLLHIQSHEFPVKTKSSLSLDAVDFCRRCVERDPQRRITAAELATHPFVTSALSTSSQRTPQSSRC
ncbi:putative protein kinase [Leptomonas pyrrhocoris]|uniref:Protein kinase domain-containing protein n=1 Tax=Leptomonas pyrrhocoris TaxID=157538 RepID=A0A0M9G4A3_LEPPY|nr:putative protein kinase [Leptomonas pyrrhocoris]KPA81816.1 putative protein kinase [Leptomonas pyrrhocoris]|eukprot:XP_015660255.1 putative protein kinase [Leptomonas pyrrhocoris]